jgi:hypothetical protein
MTHSAITLAPNNHNLCERMQALMHMCGQVEVCIHCMHQKACHLTNAVWKSESARWRWKRTSVDIANCVLINNQLDAQFLLYTFILILYMFRATQCSSSEESNVSIQHLVHHSDRLVCRSGSSFPTCIKYWLYWLIQLTLLMMSTGLLETCRESK